MNTAPPTVKDEFITRDEFEQKMNRTDERLTALEESYARLHETFDIGFAMLEKKIDAMNVGLSLSLLDIRNILLPKRQHN